MQKKSVVFLCYLLAATLLFTGCSGGNVKETESGNNSSLSRPTSSDEGVSREEDASNAEPPVSSENNPSEDTSSENITVNTDKTPWVAPAPERTRTPITVSKVAEKNGRYYVEHNGKPYLQYGVQVVVDRVDFTPAQREEFFQKAAEIGFKSVNVAIRWRDIEPKEGKYNLYRVSEYIGFAEKYGIDLELLWFGSNVCGAESNSPDYILDDFTKYPMIGNNDFDYSNNALLKREQAALLQVMNYIYDNDKARHVSTIQILNEPNFSGSYDAQKDAFLNYLDQLGRTVKNSPYRVVTRVNLVISKSFLDTEYKMPEEVLALEGIDMVGPDVYVSDLEDLGRYITRFTDGNMSKNVSHLAEGPGQMYNVIKQILYSFSLNSGFKVYELKAYGNTDCEFGIFRTNTFEWIKRDGTKRTMFQWDRDVKVDENVTDDIITLNGMINSVSEQIATCPVDNFAMIFRQSNGYIGNQKIRFETAEKRAANRVGAIFLAADGYYYCFTPAQNGSFSFVDKTVSGNASIGYFKNGVWQESDKAALEGNRLNVKKGNVYRLSLAQVK